jgi:hypothetical protein
MGWGGKLKSIVKAVAPTLGTALGGPAGGMAAKIISEGILGKPDASEAEIEDFLLTASPEQMLELKKLDAQFAVDMKKLDIDVFRIESDDKKSARAMFGINIWPQISLTALFTVGYFVVLIVLLTGSVSIPVESQPVVNVVIGVLTAGMSTVLAFWFGSSVGSKEKNDMIGNKK